MKHLVFLFLLFPTLQVFAIDVIYSCPSGSWSNAGCWSTGNLPGSSDRAVIGSPNSVEINSNVTVGSVLASGNITVTNTGILNVNGGISLINQNLGTLDIAGTVNLDKGGVTLETQNRMIIRAVALLNIVNADSDAINSEGEVKINLGGELIITDAGQYGVVNSGGFINNGKLTIDGAVTGFLQTGFTDSLVNNQVIFIKNCTEYGLESDGGLIENYDRLKIENTTMAGLFGHGANGDFSDINNHENAVMLVYSGISNTNDFLNNGYVYCSGNQISSFATGDLINNDSIIISTENSVGLTFNGNFINNAQGVVLSDTITITDGTDYFFASGKGGVENHGSFTFDLKGQMNGLSHGSTSINSETFFNYNVIDIKNAKKGLELEYFSNLPGAIIDVDSCYATGLTVVGDSVINEGQISLRNGQADFGFTTLSFGSFYNRGMLNIENHEGAEGVYNYSTLLMNETEGVINLTFSGSGAAFSNASGEFINHGKVEVTVQGTAVEGLFIGSNSLQSFNNHGTFRLINESLSSVPNGIFVNGVMTIDTCSTFITELPFQVQAIGTVNNYGLLSLSDSARINNDGTFNNDGIIEGLNGFHAGKLTLNDGLVTAPIFNSLTVGKKYASSIIGTPTFDIQNSLYADAMETELAGTFLNDYESLKIEGYESMDTLYFTTNMYGICDLQVRLPVLKTDAYSCLDTTDISFASSSDESWFNADNWSLSRLPNACDKVVIPSDKRVKLLSDEFGRAQFIDIISGGVLDTESGAILDIR